ncbi:MAG: hypothetical protein ACLVJK_05400 [Alistipes putredinis]
MAYLAATVANLGVEYSFTATTTRSICRSSTAPTPWHATTACVFWLFSPNSATG